MNKDKFFSIKKAKVPMQHFRLTACILHLSLIASEKAIAQDAVMHYHNVYNRSVQYAPLANEYLLLGQNTPTTISGMSNSSAVSYLLNRMQLQLVDPSSLNTTMEKTYCTQDEVNDYPNCNHLGVEWTVKEARPTSDGGYIVCGRLRKDVETACTPGNYYFKPFLMKLTSTGAVSWCMKYDSLIDFSSIIEDPTGTGNIICCGLYGFGSTSYVTQGFTMAVNSMGIPITNSLSIFPASVPAPQNPSIPGQSYYSKINSYIDGSGNTYFVAVGILGGSLSGYADMIYTVVNNMGATPPSMAGFNCVQVSAYPSDGYIQGVDITDAHDGTVIIAGGAIIYKVDPQTHTASYLNQYYTSSGTSIFANGITRYNAFGDAYVTGAEKKGSCFILDINASSGAVTDYELYNNYMTAWVGNYITYNSNSSVNTAVICGDAYPMQSFITRYIPFPLSGNCASQFTLNLNQLTPNYPVIPSPTLSTSNYWAETIIDFDMTPDENISCGSPKMGTTGIANIEKVKTLTLMPNPADNNIEVLTPDVIAAGDLKIVDMMGRIIISRKLDNTSKIQINIASLSKGVYVVKIDYNGVSQQRRFIKQ